MVLKMLKFSGLWMIMSKTCVSFGMRGPYV